MRRPFFTAVVALATLFGAVSAPTAASASESVAMRSMQRVAMVRVDVREADGTVVRGPTRAVPWGEAAAFRLRSPVHEHAIDVQYGAAGSQLNLSYSRDGATTLERVIGQRQTVIRTESGALVTVRVVLTKVHLDAVPG